jgi:hypothetical protein
MIISDLPNPMDYLQNDPRYRPYFDITNRAFMLTSFWPDKIRNRHHIPLFLRSRWSHMLDGHNNLKGGGGHMWHTVLNRGKLLNGRESKTAFPIRWSVEQVAEMIIKILWREVRESKDPSVRYPLDLPLDKPFTQLVVVDGECVVGTVVLGIVMDNDKPLKTVVRAYAKRGVGVAIYENGSMKMRRLKGDERFRCFVERLRLLLNRCKVKQLNKKENQDAE